MKNISKFILYNMLGWEILGKYPKNLKKFIIIGAPHTSNYDFVISLLMKFILSLPANFIAKASLFQPPFSFIFKALGGVPIDRSKSENRVEAIIDVFNKRDQFILAIAPEGTRKLTKKWKTGFYHIAKGAHVPIVMNGFDFEEKKYRISKPYYLTENIEKDFLVFYNFYKNIKGKYPNQFKVDFNKNLD